jgi:hypothetical protein
MIGIPIGPLSIADAGVPMIVFTLPALLMLLLPVILIEGFLCKKWLGLSTWEAMKSNAVANLASTIVGMPLAWGIMLAVELGGEEVLMHTPVLENSHSPILYLAYFLLSAPWIYGEPAWTIPAAVLVLLIPFFFASYAVEYRVIRSMLVEPAGNPSNQTRVQVRTAVRNANLVTYAILGIATSVWLAISLRRN